MASYVSIAGRDGAVEVRTGGTGCTGGTRRRFAILLTRHRFNLIDYVE